MNVPKRTRAAIIALAILLAVIVTLLSGSWKQSVRAEDVESTATAAWVAQQVEHRLHAPESAGSEVAGSSPAPWAVAPTRSGTWAYANASHGSGYLAIPEGPGYDVTVCGPKGCLERVSTDAGPVLSLQRAGRIGDLSSAMFREICGPLSAGLCRGGSYTILGVADQHPEDPPADPRDDAMRDEVRDLPLPATDSAL